MVYQYLAQMAEATRRPLAAIGDIITQPLTWMQPIDKCKVNWIDDMTVCAVVDSQTLVPEDRQLPKPVPYHAAQVTVSPRPATHCNWSLNN